MLLSLSCRPCALVLLSASSGKLRKLPKERKKNCLLSFLHPFTFFFAASQEMGCTRHCSYYDYCQRGGSFCSLYLFRFSLSICLFCLFDSVLVSSSLIHGKRGENRLKNGFHKSASLYCTSIGCSCVAIVCFSPPSSHCVR